MNWGNPEKRPVFTCARCGVKTTVRGLIYWSKVHGMILCGDCREKWFDVFTKFMKEGKKDVNI